MLYTHLYIHTCTHTLGVSIGKESSCNAGGSGLIPWSERSPGEENGNPHLENPMDRAFWQATVHEVVRVESNLVTKPHIHTHTHTHTHTQCNITEP